MKEVLEAIAALTQKVDEMAKRLDELAPKNEIGTFKEVADFLGCSISTVKRSYKDWGVAYKKVGRSVYFKPFTWDDLGGVVFDPKDLLKKHRMRQILGR